MKLFLLALVISLIVSAIGFKKYVWFISLGYGFSIAAIGLALLLSQGSSVSALTIVYLLLFMVYGLRLGGYLAIRELKSKSYNSVMKKEIKSGKGMPMAAKAGIWVTASLLYACETAPVLFRIQKETGSAAAASGANAAAGSATASGALGVLIAGLIISICGLILESTADFQKNAAKKKNPHRFVDMGLFLLVRCPNYLGEMLFWTGVFVSGFGICHGFWQWLAALSGYIGIIYVMFGGARRLEMRQNRNYGSDPEYQAYVKKTPIMIPFIPLYSVEKYKWLVA